MAYVKRAIESSILEAGENFPCIVLYGSRQVGKSTTIEKIYPNFKLVTLDNKDDRYLAINNPRGFLDSYPYPLIIDEIQKAPDLLSEIKIRIDEQKKIWLKEDKPYELMYVLTGSNQYELQNGVSESLAGRGAVMSLFSFSHVEIDGKQGFAFSPKIASLRQKENDNRIAYRSREKIFADIFMGGMPDVVTHRSKRDIYFKSYIDTYIEKDIRKLIAPGNEMIFSFFMEYVSLRTGQEANYDDIARGVGIDVKTVKKWLSMLETSGIIVMLRPYMANASKRIIKAPKLYFMDTGLASYLCKWQDEEMLQKGVMSGAIYETYVVSEIIKSLSFRNVDYKQFLYYYRDIDQKEIDLLYVDRDDIYPIEIKKGIAPEKPTKNFSVLKKYGKNIIPGLVIDSIDHIRPINESAYYCPIDLIGL